MHPLAKIHQDAVRDGFVDARAGGLPAGVHPRTLVRQLRRMEWKPWSPGFWAPGDGDPPYLVRCRIVLAMGGADAMLTGASALWALDVLRSEPDDVEVLLPASRWVGARPGVCVHYAAEQTSIRTVSGRGLRLAGTARAIADYSRHTGVTSLCRTIADSERLRHCTLQQIGEEIDGRTRFPGRARLRHAHAELTGELNHSRYERLGRGLLRDAAVDVPPRPRPVVHRERNVAEIDIPFFDVRYGVEIDGPPHLLLAQAAKDAARDRMLSRDCGWTIDRFWWFELEEDPERFTREVTARLRSLGSIAVRGGVGPRTRRPPGADSRVTGR